MMPKRKKGDEAKSNKEDEKDGEKDPNDSGNKDDIKDPLSEKHAKMKDLKSKAEKKQKNQIVIKFDVLDEKGSKILKKLARFLL